MEVSLLFKSKKIKEHLSAPPARDTEAFIRASFMGREKLIPLCTENTVPNGSRKTMYSMADQVLMVSDMVKRRASEKDFDKFLKSSKLVYQSDGNKFELSMAKAYSVSNSTFLKSNMPRNLESQLRYGLDSAEKNVSINARAFDRIGLSIASHSGMEAVYLALNNKEYIKTMGDYLYQGGNQVIFDKSSNTCSFTGSGRARILVIGEECKNPQDLVASSYLMGYMNKNTPSLEALSSQYGPKQAELINQNALGSAILESSGVMDILKQQILGREQTSKLITGEDHAAIKKGIEITSNISNDAEYTVAVREMIQTVAVGYIQRQVKDELEVDISP
jgi:hypothetical protein